MTSVLILFVSAILLVDSSATFSEIKSHHNEKNGRESALGLSQMEESILEVINHFATSHQKLAMALKSPSSRSNLTLKGLPRECIEEVEHQLESGIERSLGNFTNCNVLNIFTNLAIVMIDSLRFAVEMSFESFIIFGQVVACSGTLNPFIIIRCIYKAFTELPAEFGELIDITREYKDTLEYFIPKIFHSIESCFNRTASEYSAFVDFTLNDPQVCRSS